MHVPNHHVWLHSQDYCEPAIVHEVAVSAGYSAVCVGVTAVEQCDSVLDSSFTALTVSQP